MSGRCQGDLSGEEGKAYQNEDGNSRDLDRAKIVLTHNRCPYTHEGLNDAQQRTKKKESQSLGE